MNIYVGDLPTEHLRRLNQNTLEDWIKIKKILKCQCIWKYMRSLFSEVLFLKTNSILTDMSGHVSSPPPPLPHRRGIHDNNNYPLWSPMSMPGRLAACGPVCALLVVCYPLTAHCQYGTKYRSQPLGIPFCPCPCTPCGWVLSARPGAVTSYEGWLPRFILAHQDPGSSAHNASEK